MNNESHFIEALDTMPGLTVGRLVHQQRDNDVRLYAAGLDYGDIEQ